VFDEGNIRKFRQRQYGLAVLTIELEARLSTSQSRLVRTLLAEGVSKTKQADGEIHEDQL